MTSQNWLLIFFGKTHSENKVMEFADDFYIKVRAEREEAASAAPGGPDSTWRRCLGMGDRATGDCGLNRCVEFLSSLLCQYPSWRRRVGHQLRCHVTRVKVRVKQ